MPAVAYLPEQRRPAPAGDAPPRSLTAPGTDVVVERRRGGLPAGFPRAVLVLDGVLVLVSLALAWQVRSVVPGVRPAGGLLLALEWTPLLVVVWLAALSSCGAYDRHVFGQGTDEFQAVLKASALTISAVATICFLTDTALARDFLVSALVVGGAAVTGGRYAVRRWLHAHRSAGSMTHRVLAVGPPSAVRDLERVFARERHLGYELVACTVPDGSAAERLPAPAVGSVRDIGVTCAKLGIDTVMVTGGTDVVLREVMWDLEEQDVQLVVVPDLEGVAAPRLCIRPMAGLPFLHVEKTRAQRAGQWPKRLFDVLGASLLLVALAPVGAAVALAVKLGDGGPVLFRQVRVGLEGQLFGCYKFRTMVADAEALDTGLRQEHGDDILFKLKEDPRITRVGRFLRRYSLDELPQLLNVLTGSMSLVGPRPHLPKEVQAYVGSERRRLQVRPGMTGLWQVSGRADLPWSESVRLDLYYRDNWSMVSDLAIMARTLKAVVAKRGAY